MLSLNALHINPQDARIAPEAKGKTRAADDNKQGNDFAAYMAAMNQPAKPELPQQVQAKAAEPVIAEKAAPVQTAVATAPATEQTAPMAQKAGHGSSEEHTENNPTNAKENKTEREASEVKNTRTQPVRSERELLETLGLITKKTGVNAAESLQKTARAASGTASATTTQLKTQTLRGEKNQIAAATLQQLQKTPDLILANADGLKRLGEKLGLAFLGKVSEKLGEKSLKPEGPQTSTKTEQKAEALVQTTTARVQKAGDGNHEQNTAFQNSGKSPKGANVKIVSRETIAADTAEKPAPLGGSDLKPVSIPDTATGRLSTAAHSEVRLAESAATIRATDNIRTAVENPLMRADLVRQFNEVMGRAQVLVADSQNAQFSVKLFPRDLGRMEIDLKMVDGEIRGKIVVENEDVKNEMQNFLDQRENSAGEQQIDLNRIDIEVRSGNQQAQNPERTPDAEAIIQNLVTRAATTAYGAAENNTNSGSALYA